MQFDALISALQANAERVAKPIPVDVPNVGMLYLRARTVDEVDKEAAAAKEQDPAKPKRSFVYLRIGQWLCQEDGARFSPEQQDAIQDLLGRQADSVITKLVTAMNEYESGGAAPGN